jgi:hypothetical protein
MHSRRLTSAPRPALVAALGIVVVVAVVLALVLGGGSGHHRLLPGGGNVDGTFDPLAFSAARQAQFEADAAAGLSHVIYAKSPGGVVASARRTAAFRPQVEAAARSGPADADTLEAIVLLESAGRSDIVAGKDLRNAAGLTQILADTGQHLLGMRVDLTAERKVAAQLRAAVRSGNAGRVAAFDKKLGRVDQRFDPAAALAATERYLTIAKRVFGRDDLAVESYHMGIGNLATGIRRYAGSGHSGDSVAKLVADNQLSYAKLLFDSSPVHHAAAYAWLSQFGDDSSTYYWRLQAARQIMQLYRSNPAELAHQNSLQTAAGSAEAALLTAHTPFFDSRQTLAAAETNGTLLAVPTGSQATSDGIAPAGPLHLKREALATLLYIAAGTRSIGKTAAPLDVTSGATDTADLPAAAAASHGLADSDPTHATGYAFDIARSYASPAQALAFQFMLDRLQTLNLIAWQRHRREIHIVAGPGASVLEGVLSHH